MELERAEGNMQLSEGKAGKADPSLAREQAIEAARSAGVLGNSNGRVSSGFDSANGTGGGTIGTGRYGTLGHGSGTGAGFGVSGFGPGGGGGGLRGRSAGPSADEVSAEVYKDYGKNAWTDAAADHLSTFAADVDTASYTITRRKLTEGTLPPREAVRVEELVNYFKYTYAQPASGQPFSVAMDLAPSPFSAERHILRVGVSSKPISIRERKPAHLVFLVDVSGSMYSPDKLPLAKRSLRILVDNLHDGDTVAMVTYAGRTRVVLPPTGVDQRGRILAAIEDLSASGSTAMGDGIKLAYAQAAKRLTPDSISRVIVLSDGDANVGSTKHEEILKTIEGNVKQGVTLSTIGFGMGNYKDELMEQLANKGNGNNFYIDGLSAAKRVFQEQLGATLEVVAKDVKLQVDFDPAQVKRYRLIGYENRNVRDQDFRDDKVDAGEIGAGHQVTALYELELSDARRASTAPIVTARVRHKAPLGDTATEAAVPLGATAIAPSFQQANTDLRFAFAVAAFADVLRGGADAKDWDLAAIKTIAAAAANGSADRKELVGLIDRAITLRTRTARNP
ncbi:MAG TPA: von Willebrand factor type A domain-containing protein [Kofleriaceae bacterium]|nr:von Willebrand factor type A domain-containing protein [Kofleriaceae bacterium]